MAMRENVWAVTTVSGWHRWLRMPIVWSMWQWCRATTRRRFSQAQTSQVGTAQGLSVVDRAARETNRSRPLRRAGAQSGMRTRRVSSTPISKNGEGPDAVLAALSVGALSAWLDADATAASINRGLLPSWDASRGANCTRLLASLGETSFGVLRKRADGGTDATSKLLVAPKLLLHIIIVVVRFPVPSKRR